MVKYRFPKTYRHPTLDATLTKTRLSFEARALARCTRAGVTVPRVLWVDEGGGVLGMEKVEGWSVREVLGGGAEGEGEMEEEGEAETETENSQRVENEGDVNGMEDVEESEGMIALKNLGVTQGEHDGDYSRDERLLPCIRG